MPAGFSGCSVKDSFLIYSDSTTTWPSLTLLMSLSFFKRFMEKYFERADQMQEKKLNTKNLNGFV